MLFILASLVSLYWLTVTGKSILFTLKNGMSPNVLPKETQGILSRLVMLPLILFWNYLPWHAFDTGFVPPNMFFASIGLLCAVISLSLSYYCWYFMGREWRIGINLKEKTNLITNGPFKYVRHPIYTLSMLLMIGTFLCLQSFTAFALLIVHIVVFSFEAWREEQYILNQNGSDYLVYMSRTGRFIPPLFSR